MTLQVSIGLSRLASTAAAVDEIREQTKAEIELDDHGMRRLYMP
jgi:hypothetical protein